MCANHNVSRMTHISSENMPSANPHHKWVVCTTPGCKFNGPWVMRIGATGCYTGHLSIKEVPGPNNKLPESKNGAVPFMIPGELLRQLEAWGDLQEPNEYSF